MLHIEMTGNQHGQLVELLNDVSVLYTHEAAALLQVSDECEQARKLAMARLEAAEAAEELIRLLAKY